MTSQVVFEFFRELSPNEQEGFIGLMSLWFDLNLPDGDYLIIRKQEYARLLRNASIIDSDALYEVAKTITLEAGMPWTDPRTQVTYKP